MTVRAMGRGPWLAALVAAQVVAGCGGGGSKDLHASISYGMAGCSPLAHCSTAPTITGLEGHTPTIALAPGATLPAWATLDPTTGEVSGVPTGPADLTIGVEMTVVGYQGSLPALVLLTVYPLVLHLAYDSLPEFSDEIGVPITPFNASVGGPGYSVDLAPGVACAYAVSAGAPPPGVTVDAVTGLVSGVPTASGTFDFEVTATMVYQGTTYTAMKPKSLRVDPLPTHLPYPQGDVYGVGGNVYLTAGTPMAALAPNLADLGRGAGAVADYHVSAGFLPTGLTIDAATGVITGTLEAAGSSVGQSWDIPIAATLTRGAFTGPVTTVLRFTRLY